MNITCISIYNLYIYVLIYEIVHAYICIHTYIYYIIIYHLCIHHSEFAGLFSIFEVSSPGGASQPNLRRG